MTDDAMNYLRQGKSLMFTFKEEAKRFAKRNKLTIEYSDGEFIDDEHYKVKGYNANLYWI